MKKKLFIPITVLCIAALGFAMWSFIPKSSIVGTWSIVGSGFGNAVKATAEFNEDGTFTINSIGNTQDMANLSEGQSLVFETIIVGTWKVDGTELDMIFNDQGLKINGQRIARTTTAQNSEKQKILGTLNSYSPYALKWVNPDQFETTSKDQTRRYTRLSKE